MQAKYIFGSLLFVVLFGIVATAFASSFNNTKIQSPLPEKTYANVLDPTNTPSPTPSPTPTNTPTPIPPTPTRTPTPTPIIIAPQNLEELFTKYSNEYSVDKDLLKRIASCESGLNASASTSRYAGLYQFSESLWVSARTLMGHDSNTALRFNPEESIRTAAFMIGRGRLNIWPNCSK